MGRRGPAPKPTSLRVLEGNPGKRPLPAGEPKPRVGVGECPGWLSDVAKGKWAELVPELERLGLLTVIDGDALASYCETYAEWRRSVEFLRENGTVYESARGLIARPEVGISQRARTLMRQYAQEFGLTPSARVRLGTTNKQQESDELDELLMRPARRS